MKSEEQVPGIFDLPQSTKNCLEHRDSHFKIKIIASCSNNYVAISALESSSRAALPWECQSQG